jgi:hypothetical protein
MNNQITRRLRRAPVEQCDRARYLFEVLESRVLLSSGAWTRGSFIANGAPPPSVAEAPPTLPSDTSLTHTTAILSEGRANAASTTVGSVAFIAGTEFEQDDAALVDVYDSTADRWSTIRVPGGGAAAGDDGGTPAVSSIATKIIFTDGYANVYFYETNSGQWSTGKLSLARNGFQIVPVGDKVLFAGGVIFPNGNDIDRINVVDVYDTATGQWSVTTFPHLDGFMLSVATAGTKAIFSSADGAMDMYDAATGRWVDARPPLARGISGATTVGSKAVFAGAKYIVAYDDSTGRWSRTRWKGADGAEVALTVGEKALFAGSDFASTYDVDTGRVSTRRIAAGDVFGRVGGVATTQGIAIVTGGENGRGPDASAFVYHANTNRWSRTQLATARSFLCGVSLPNRVLFAGGVPMASLVDVFTATSASRRAV